MSTYPKALGLHVYLATIKKIYFDNNKYIEANAQAMEALRHTLGKKYLSIVSHCDSAFAVWNTFTFLKEQAQHILERIKKR